MGKNDNKGVNGVSEPFVSVLTPVYNGEQFISECIESVLNQNYSNWEHVIVNNFSKDDTLKIAHAYAEKEPRIRIYNNDEFLEQKDNLNHAFRQISPESKYCKVVYADDFLYKDCLKEMVSLAEEYPTVGIVSSYYLDQDEVRPGGIEYTSRMFDGKEIGRDYLRNSHKYFGNPSNLLIPTKIILEREEPYDPSEIHSDHGFCLDILRDHDFGFVHQILTFTRRHENSVTKEVLERFDTYALGRLTNLNNYGKYFLDEAEFEDLRNQRIEAYLRKIAAYKLFKSQEVVNFHYSKVKNLGLDISRWKLIKYMMAEVFSLKRNFSGIMKKIFKLNQLSNA